jgi:hypothetical protein
VQVYDLGSGKYLGLTESVHVTLDPWQPTLLALTPEALPDGDVIARLHQQADAAK